MFRNVDANAVASSLTVVVLVVAFCKKRHPYCWNSFLNVLFENCLSTSFRFDLLYPPSSPISWLVIAFRLCFFFFFFLSLNRFLVYCPVFSFFLVVRGRRTYFVPHNFVYYKNCSALNSNISSQQINIPLDIRHFLLTRWSLAPSQTLRIIQVVFI